MTRKSSEMKPLQTSFQMFLLDLHAIFIAVCLFLARPFLWVKEQVDGGSASFRNYNKRNPGNPGAGNRR